jgi:signal transduction histidine kinase
VEERRAEILALAYGLGGFAAIAAWVADPAGITNAYGVGIPVALALGGSVTVLLLRQRLPRHTEDLFIGASLVLIPVAGLNLADHSLLQPYYVWVGFASPLWFPVRRSLVYLVLTALAAGAGAADVGTRMALAAWFVTVATVLLAFVAVHFLTRMMVSHERLAAVGEMASAIGHELRNPLGAVTNALYLARMGLPPSADPDVEYQLELAERQTARAVAIADDLRAFVRPRRPQVAPVDVPALVAQVLEATPAPPGVTVHLDVRPVALEADRGQLAEVLTNLVENAYQAMPDGGTLRVESTDDHGRVAFSVADTGVGIDEPQTTRIFEPFFTTRAQGTGLGLAIVERLVEEHGGTVTVKSVPGRGTRFTVRLPRTSPAGSG